MKRLIMFILSIAIMSVSLGAAASAFPYDPGFDGASRANK